jgi:hypothetical protein
MKIKILSEFQKNQFYNDNMSANWILQTDKLVDDSNKFHFFKYLEIDETWEFKSNERYIFPIFWKNISHSSELLKEFSNAVIQFVEQNIQLFLNEQLILVFLDPLEGNWCTTKCTNDISLHFKDRIKNIYYISGNYNSKNQDNFFKFLYVEQWQYHLDPLGSIIEYTPKKDYINLNRMARIHRCILMQKIIDNNLINEGYNTWANSSNWDAEMSSKHSSFNLFDTYSTLNPNNTINNQKYDTLDCEYVGNENPTLKTPTEFCKNTFVYIVTETHTNNEDFFISEKTYKPIAIGMPFIVLGNPGTLSYLREKGYATFSDWIDESYDKDLPIEERIDIVVQNLIRISKMSDIEKINIRRQMNINCEHNLNLYKILNKKNNFIETLKLIQRGMI